jgi:hypothetical protein
MDFTLTAKTLSNSSSVTSTVGYGLLVLLSDLLCRAL